MGDEVALVALLIYLFDSGSGTPAVSALLLSAAIPSVVLATWAGQRVDRTDSRSLLTTVAALQAVACLAIASVLVVEAALVWLVAAVFVLSALQVLAGPAWQVLVPTIVGEEQTGRAYSALQSLVLLAGIAGPAIGGLVVGLWSPATAIVLDGVSFLLLAVVALQIRTRRRPAAPDEHQRVRPLDGLRSIRADALLLPLFIGLMAFIVVGEMTNVVEVFLVQGALDGTPLVFGVVGGLFAAGAVLGSLLAGRARDDTQRAYWAVLSAATLAAGLVVAGLAPSLVVFGGVWAASGVALGVLNVVVMTLVVVRTQETRRGLVLATTNGVSRAMALMATVAGGVLGAWAGPRWTFVIAGSLALLVAGLMGVGVARARRRNERKTLGAAVVLDDA